MARKLAQRLGYVYIDTGAMYRSVALLAKSKDVSWNDAAGLARVARDLDLRFEPNGEQPKVLVGGQDVSLAIRSPDMDRGSSEVSRWPGVREALVAKQRELAEHGGVVMEGRDIGTVVFPHARAKFFVTATVEERARRRTAELQARGEAVDPDQVRSDVAERDRRDMEREHSPLCRAEDAMEVITDGLTVEQVIDRLEQTVREREQV